MDTMRQALVSTLEPAYRIQYGYGVGMVSRGPHGETAPTRKTALQRLREERGWSQEELAAKVNATKATVSKHERGHRRISRDWAMRYANALEVHWTELWGEAAPLNPRERHFVDLLRGLNESDRDTVFRVTDALAEQRGKKVGNGA